MRIFRKMLGLSTSKTQNTSLLEPTSLAAFGHLSGNQQSMVAEALRHGQRAPQTRQGLLGPLPIGVSAVARRLIGGTASAAIVAPATPPESLSTSAISRTASRKGPDVSRGPDETAATFLAYCNAAA